MCSRVSLVIGLLFLAGCASHREPPLPTLEDYSDGVSSYTERFLEDWKAGAKDGTLYSGQFGWRGPLPGDALIEVPSRPPLHIALSRAPGGADSARPRDTEALRRRLAEIRGRFASLGRTEQVLFDFRRRGDRREIVLGKKLEKGLPIGEFGEDSLWGHPPKRFYKNLDGRHFAELAAVTGLESDANQRGLVVTDVNGDGAPDLFATGFLQRSSLWINQNPSRAKSLVVTLEGDPSLLGRYKSTREALGAIVTVEANGIKRAQVVSAGYSFLSSGSKSLFFGLGDRDSADRVMVKWPSGRFTKLKDVPAGKLSLKGPGGSPD